MFIFIFLSIFITSSIHSILADRTMTIVNNCQETIWPAFYSAAHPPDHPTGWEAHSGHSISLTIPTGWIGRVWGRTQCDFGNSNPATQCSTGGCLGGLKCINPGVPPATLAELTIDSDGTDWLDISLVDGFNLPMLLENTGTCYSPACPANINTICPSVLQVQDGTGNVVGCKSDCLVSATPSNSPACCSGAFSTPQTCPVSGVQHYSTFKDACPEAYAYAYDDQTSLKTCAAKEQVDYTVTFCPSHTT